MRLSDKFIKKFKLFLCRANFHFSRRRQIEFMIRRLIFCNKIELFPYIKPNMRIQFFISNICLTS